MSRHEKLPRIENTMYNYFSIKIQITFISTYRTHGVLPKWYRPGEKRRPPGVIAAEKSRAVATWSAPEVDGLGRLKEVDGAQV